ncbi:hypothetical protein ACFSTD_14250 [Novosphingobium colocasiae]
MKVTNECAGSALYCPASTSAAVDCVVVAEALASASMAGTGVDTASAAPNAEITATALSGPTN